jgi:hypothetical protein
MKPALPPRREGAAETPRRVGREPSINPPPVEEQSRNNRGTIEEQSRNNRGTIEEQSRNTRDRHGADNGVPPNLLARWQLAPGLHLSSRKRSRIACILAIGFSPETPPAPSERRRRPVAEPPSSIALIFTRESKHLAPEFVAHNSAKPQPSRPDRSVVQFFQSNAPFFSA